MCIKFQALGIPSTSGIDPGLTLGQQKNSPRKCVYICRLDFPPRGAGLRVLVHARDGFIVSAARACSWSRANKGFVTVKELMPDNRKLLNRSILNVCNKFKSKLIDEKYETINVFFQCQRVQQFNVFLYIFLEPNGKAVNRNNDTFQSVHATLLIDNCKEHDESWFVERSCKQILLVKIRIVLENKI